MLQCIRFYGHARICLFLSFRDEELLKVPPPSDVSNTKIIIVIVEIGHFKSMDAKAPVALRRR